MPLSTEQDVVGMGMWWSKRVWILVQNPVARAEVEDLVDALVGVVDSGWSCLICNKFCSYTFLHSPAPLNSSVEVSCNDIAVCSRAILLMLLVIRRKCQKAGSWIWKKTLQTLTRETAVRFLFPTDSQWHQWWPRSFPNLNHMFIIITMMTKHP